MRRLIQKKLLKSPGKPLHKTSAEGLSHDTTEQSNGCGVRPVVNLGGGGRRVAPQFRFDGPSACDQLKALSVRSRRRRQCDGSAGNHRSAIAEQRHPANQRIAGELSDTIAQAHGLEAGHDFIADRRGDH
jgi:hypothetical protein